MRIHSSSGELVHRRRIHSNYRVDTCPNQALITGTARKCSRTYFLIAIGTAILVLAAIGIVHITSAMSTGGQRLEPPDPQVSLPPSPSILRQFKTGAVCSDGPPCSSIGSEILQQNGSAVDAAIATLFCNGIVNCHSMGLGGGFLMTIYKRDTHTAYFLNAREAAPGAATPGMFHANPNLARRGPLATGVPGELAGYWAAHRRFGRLSWSKLIEPSLKICREGYNMSQHQHNALGIAAEYIHNDETLREVFVDPSDGNLRKMGSRIIQKQLCETLRTLATEGADDFYKGNTGKMFVKDVRELGGILTEADLAKYRVHWSEPVKLKMKDGRILYTAPPPGSGAILSLIINILSGYNFSGDSVATINNTILTYHRTVEAFKYAFAKRTELGDPKFVDTTELVRNSTMESFGNAIRESIDDQTTYNDPQHYGAIFYNSEDHGTAHASVISSDGDAVSVTSTINLYFGAGLSSKSTGIILNSGMDDFSFSQFKNFFGLTGSPANRLEPGKQPLSSMSPTIMVDPHGDVSLVIGAAGGTKIPTSVAYVIMRHLWFGDDIKTAIDSSRLHHQLYPMTVNYEYGVLEQIVTGLQRLGHHVTRYRNSISVICAIAQINGTILANADYRKKGDVHGF